MVLLSHRILSFAILAAADRRAEAYSLCVLHRASAGFGGGAIVRRRNGISYRE
jgi:hypothetical protein